MCDGCMDWMVVTRRRWWERTTQKYHSTQRHVECYVEEVVSLFHSLLAAPRKVEEIITDRSGRNRARARFF
jgi:hypothetical protein